MNGNAVYVDKLAKSRFTSRTAWFPLISTVNLQGNYMVILTVNGMLLERPCDKKMSFRLVMVFISFGGI